MKKWVKVVLIILAIILVILVGAGIYAYKTYMQVKGLMELQSLQNDQQFKDDMVSLGKGDCSKLPSVESKMNEVQQKLKDACANPLLRSQIDKQQGQVAGTQLQAKSICDEINNPNSPMANPLAAIKTVCANQTKTA